MKLLLGCFLTIVTFAMSYAAMPVNLAAGNKVSFFPPPNYRLCTDKQDEIQLTDGKYVTTGGFWGNKGAVGWTRRGTVQVTVDLGKIQPISGFAWNCAAGRAGVVWPNLILVMVSDDNKTWYPVGNLVKMTEGDKPMGDGFKIFKYMAKDVNTYGRYVKFMTASPGPYIFVDEIEVYPGSQIDLKLSRGESMAPKDYADSKQFLIYVWTRFTKDLQALQKVVKNSKVDDQTKTQLLLKIERLKEKMEREAEIKCEGFKAIIPYNAWHRQLIGIRADLWQARGLNKLLVNNANRWDMLRFWNEPDISTTPKPLKIAMMRNEKRAVAVNISNPFARNVKIQLSTTGNIPQDMLKFSRVEWVDTRKGIPVAAALIALGNEPLEIIPGMTRQLWIQSSSLKTAAGKYTGEIILDAGTYGKINLPITVKVAPITFPERPKLHLGGWDYTDQVPSRGITRHNLHSVEKYLQESFVDVPWATNGTMPFGRYDKSGRMTKDPDSDRFDKWVTRWPNARIYAVFANVPDNIQGLKMGTPAFVTAVTNWSKWWKQHCLDKGLKPEQIALLLVDEPHSKKQDERILAWAQIIKKACPEFIIWEDPTWKTPAKHLIAMLDIADVLCPNRPMYLSNKAYRDFYAKRAKKQTLWLYSCSGPSRLLDPYSYFLLQGWECIRIGAKSTHFWAFGDTGGGKSSWNPYLQKSTSYVPYYLGEKTATPAKYMEAIVESVRDYEYFMMLKDAIATAKKRGVAKDIILKTEKLLQSGPAKVLDAANASELEWTVPKDTTIANKVRLQVLNLLIELKPK